MRADLSLSMWCCRFRRDIPKTVYHAFRQARPTRWPGSDDPPYGYSPPGNNHCEGLRFSLRQ
jgi:hypothetical protein